MADVTAVMNNQSSTVASIMDKYGVKPDEGTTSTGMDKDAFLNLLATQMQYQDPLEPQSNEDMLAQMAQFSALEQMQNINSSTLMQQAYSLMGKNVLGVAESEVVGRSEYVEGVVEAVTLKNGQPYLRVNGKDIALDKVEATLNTESALNQAYGLVGKNIKGSVYDADTKKTEAIEGFVTSVSMKEGVPYLMVNDKEIAYSSVDSVYDRAPASQIELELAIQKISKSLEDMNEKLDKLSN